MATRQTIGMVAGLLRMAELDEQIGTVTADGAGDTRKCHATIVERQTTASGASFGPMAVSPSLPFRKN